MPQRQPVTRVHLDWQRTFHGGRRRDRSEIKRSIWKSLPTENHRSDLLSEIGGVEYFEEISFAEAIMRQRLKNFQF